MALLRNSKESWMDVAPDSVRGSFNPKRTFRLNDADAHIRRLTSFGAGLGVNLASSHPLFSHKIMEIARDGGAVGEPRNLLSFDEHDEGLQYTVGHIRESLSTLNNMRQASPEVRLDTGAYLTGTMVPFQHTGEIIPDVDGNHPNEHLGTTSKLMTTDGGGVIPHWNRWESFADDTGQPSNFIKRNNEFRRQVLREMVPPGKETRELLDHVLRNPTKDPSSHRVKNPENYSSQFVKIVTPTDEDVIDLNTGTWAKVHPDEYFPH